MSPPDDEKPPKRSRDDRDVRKFKTPSRGVAEGYPSDRDRHSRSMPALQRDERDDEAVPNEDIEDTSIPIPTGLNPVQELQVQLARAMSRSNLALSEVKSVRSEMTSGFTAMNSKSDSIASKVDAASGEMRLMSDVLNRQLEASQKQQELVLQAMLSALASTNETKNAERKADGAHKRSISEKIVIAVIGVLLAVQTWLFATK